MNSDRVEQFRDRVRQALVDRARRDPREDVLEAAAEVYRHEARILARAFDHLPRERLEGIVDDVLLEASEIQRETSEPLRASDLIEFESNES